MATRSDPRPAPNPTCYYLGVSQFTYGGSAACPTVAAYEACYLLYSTRPTLESISRYLQLACEDWVGGIRAGIHTGRYEHVTEPYKRHPFIKKSMRLDEDSEMHGLMLSTPELYRNLPSQFQQYQMGGFNDDLQVFSHTAHGIRPAFERILKVVREQAQADPKNGGVRAFVFSRKAVTMAGSCRILPNNGGERWDFVDSHERMISFAAPQRGESSAIWYTCYTLDQAVRVMEDLFPPESNVADLHRIAENADYTTLRPKCMYSITVFKKEFETASAAQSFYAQKLKEWHYHQQQQAHPNGSLVPLTTVVS